MFRPHSSIPMVALVLAMTFGSWDLAVRTPLFASPIYAGVNVNSESGNSLSAAAVCPFCSAVKRTISEEMNDTDVVIFAEIAETHSDPKEERFSQDVLLVVQDVLKGNGLVKKGDRFKIPAAPIFKKGDDCLVMGMMTDEMSWSSPVQLSPRSKKYIQDVRELPEKGPKRIQFFWNFLQDKEEFLAFDAYDEFARTPYEDIRAIKDKLDRKRLLGWLEDTEVTINRKRLYYTLLGLCGSEKDLPFLEKLLTDKEKKKRGGMDALVACYLTLAGDKGLTLIDDKFLKNKDADYVETFAVIAALRFHGTEGKVIQLERILQSVRLLLDRPDLADLVIPDLARWKDWTVIDRLTELFKNADDKSKWVRVPIIQYLKVCPKPIAAKKIEELRKVDPLSVKRALAFFTLESELNAETSKSDDLDSELDAQLDQQLEKDKSKKDAEQGKKSDKRSSKIFKSKTFRC